MRVFLTFFAVLVSMICSGSELPRNKNVVLCSISSWPPYVTQPSGGLSVDIVEEAFATQGYSTTWQKMPWARALVSVKNQKCAGLSDAYYTDERSSWGWYTDSYFDIQVSLFSLTKYHKTLDSKLNRLVGLKIGLIRGASISNEFDRAVNLDKLETDSSEQLVKLLLLGRFDLIVDSEAVIQNEFAKLSSDIPLVKIDPPLAVRHLHLLFSKKNEGNKRIVESFNSGLDRLIQTGRYGEILEKYNIVRD